MPQKRVKTKQKKLLKSRTDDFMNGPTTSERQWGVSTPPPPPPLPTRSPPGRACQLRRTAWPAGQCAPWLRPLSIWKIKRKGGAERAGATFGRFKWGLQDETCWSQHSAYNLNHKGGKEGRGWRADVMASRRRHRLGTGEDSSAPHHPPPRKKL